jgi:protein arginine kinase activator
MLCQLCKQKDATVHLTQIVEDEMKKLDLCESCAKQKGVNDPTGFSLAELLIGASGGETAAPAEVKPGATAAEPRCVRCGMTQTEFKKSGRMGCSDCYNAFADSLEGLLKGMHKGTKHRGKIPASIKTALDQQETLDRLSARLQAAIAAEDFEQAAQVRDEIKAIKAAA